MLATVTVLRRRLYTTTGKMSPVFYTSPGAPFGAPQSTFGFTAEQSSGRIRMVATAPPFLPE